MWISAGIAAYLFLQLVIGYVVSRYIKSEEDYFVAGRRLGVGLASFSIFATWFGAESCMSSAAAIFEKGLSGSRSDPFGYTICLILAAFLLATQLWRRNYITLADLYRDRYSKGVEMVAILILAPTSMLWAAAQIRAFGQIIAMNTDLNVNLAVGIASVFVIIYTFMGGLMGDVIHDLLQGTIIIIGLLILLVVGIKYLGGVEAAYSAIEPARFSFIAPDESPWKRLDNWMVPILGSLVAQELISRMLACKSGKVARNASLTAATIYLFVGLMPAALGLLGPYFNMPLEHNDQFLPSLAQHLLPTSLFIIFTGALIAAILSTIDSTLLSISALVSHNLLSENMKKKLSPKKKLLMARVVVTISGIIAYFMAVSAENIYELVAGASSFGTAGLLVITLFGLLGKFGGPVPAILALVTGIVTTVIAGNILEVSAPFLTSIAAALIAYVGAEMVIRGRKKLIRP